MPPAASLPASSQDSAGGEFDQTLARNEVVHNPIFERLPGGQRFAAQDDVQRARQADQAGQTRAATPGRQYAQLRLGQSDLRRPIRGSDTMVAGQAHFEAATQTRAMNRRGRRNLEGRQSVEHALAEFNQARESPHQVARHRVQVGARDEDGILGARQHDAPEFSGTGNEIQVRIQFLQCRAIENIGGGIGTIKRQDANRVIGDLPLHQSERRRRLAR